MFWTKYLKAYIEEVKKSPEEIAGEYGFSIDLVRSIAGKFDRNEYKRRQASRPVEKSHPGHLGWNPPIFQSFKNLFPERRRNMLRKLVCRAILSLTVFTLPIAAQSNPEKGQVIVCKRE